jgi:hypothetical protein
MTPEQKLLISTSLLPVLADMLEDWKEFKHEYKQEQTRIINAIRYLDKMFMDEATDEERKQQNDIQLAFRQWITKSMEDESK